MREYKTYRKLIEKYLDDEMSINKLFSRRNFIMKVGMYADFLGWAEGKTNIKYKWKDIFYEEVLKREEYYEFERWRKEFFVNTKIDPKGTGLGAREAIVF